MSVSSVRRCSTSPPVDGGGLAGGGGDSSWWHARQTNVKAAQSMMGSLEWAMPFPWCRSHARRAPRWTRLCIPHDERRNAMLLILLLVVLVLALGGGGWGYRRYGYWGWSPAGVILVVLLVLFLTGNILR